MTTPLPFFNWSLKKALDTEPDSFIRARIRILFAILLFSLLKSGIVIGIGVAHQQDRQVIRAIVIFTFYALLTKLLLHRPARLKYVAHTLIIIGLGVVWTNIFVFAHKINLPTLQFAFMIVLSSFYTLNIVSGFIYSIIAITPVLLHLFGGGSLEVWFTSSTQELASPGFEIIVVLNFVSMIVAHYLFYRAFHANIREKEALNRQLQLAIAEANKLADSRANFLSTMSHELRTPLNSVIGVTELMLDDQPEERHKENLKILQGSTLDLLSLINNVLDFNKIDSDKLVLESVPFRIDDFMHNICSGLRMKAHDKGLSFTLSVDKQLSGVTIISDPTRLSQVIYNLVSNAIKFTGSGGVTVALDRISHPGHDVEILFSVTDTGIGIDPERHQAIFDRFTQAESHITRKYGGTGLGLAIVKQVLVLFNSAIRLESTPGSGARFYFTIPFATAPTQPLSKPAAKTKHTDLSHLRVLVAEDNDVNRSLVNKQLSRLGITPVTAENGIQALEACLAGSFDVIFMDLHMPQQDGYETTRRLRALPDPAKAGVYIIAFTASINEQQKIFDTGFNDFLYKPVNMQDLRDKLEKIAVRSEVVTRE